MSSPYIEVSTDGSRNKRLMEKSIRFFYNQPVSAFIRSHTLERSFSLHLGDMLLHDFGSYTYLPKDSYTECIVLRIRELSLL